MNKKMFDLEGAITQWRERLKWQRGFDAADIDEMETHLRDAVEVLADREHSDKEAFFEAARGFGEEEDLSRNFDRAHWEKNLARQAVYSPILAGNYLKVALRTMIKHKAYSAINLFGLAVGLACFMLITLYVRDELSYDRFFDDADRIHRVVVDRINPGVSEEPRIQTPDALGPAMQNEIPEVTRATRLLPPFFGNRTLKYDDKTITSTRYLMVENTFFEVFSLSFLRGSAKDAMTDPSSVVLTESTARLLFGAEDAFGKTLTLDSDETMKVSGVVEDIPTQSHFDFDFLLPRITRWDDCWSAQCGHSLTYFKLGPDANLDGVDAKIQTLVEANQGEARQDVYSTQPLAGWDGIHLASHRIAELKPNSDKLYINVLLSAAVFVILIAGINYVNLATARSALRAREIGVRKVVGALRKTLVQQFLTESVLTSIAAGITAIVLIDLALPYFNSTTGKTLTLFSRENIWLGWLFAAVVLVFGVASGLYPAIYLSSFKPISILKTQPLQRRSRWSLRQILVVFQFALAALLIVSVLVVQKQLDYIQTANLGFDKDQVMIIKNFYKLPKRDENFATRHALAQLPGVLKVGSTSDLVGLGKDAVGSWGSINVLGSDAEAQITAAHVDYNFLDALGIDLVEGRHFSPEFESESSPRSVILNETAARRLGLTGSVLGQQIVDSAGRTSELVGIARDFHFSSLHNEIAPFAFFFYSKAIMVAIKMRGGDIRETISQIEATWRRFVPDMPMDFIFLDSEIDQHYRSEENFRNIFSVMTGLSLFIACLGMLGLVTFTADQRTKEIGVRKVLGASVANVARLLSEEFVKLVLIANLIAWPIAYWTMSRWLQDFAYHTEIGVATFLIAGSMALVITALTVSWQAIRAATVNPVDSLKWE